ncbi:unnamed protein product [Ilex paraguariensis]|uniref:THIF-type NAD/FAD binding fold domain-containing protein n=1 Tax=Ilex paraguariensis TaxID=185542 RepID=A0ABC8RTV0_9AQUA
MLMAWGVRNIALLDSCKVAMSTLLRLPLYCLVDCLNSDFEATAVDKALNRIFPAVEAEDIVMAIWLPGHPVPSQEENSVLEDCRRLQILNDSHNAESRWLPILLCDNANKIIINAALGFDSFLAMCHGVGPLRTTSYFQAEALAATSAEKNRKLPSK